MQLAREPDGELCLGSHVPLSDPKRELNDPNGFELTAKKRRNSGIKMRSLNCAITKLRHRFYYSLLFSNSFEGKSEVKRIGGKCFHN